MVVKVADNILPATESPITHSALGTDYLADLVSSLAQEGASDSHMSISTKHKGPFAPPEIYDIWHKHAARRGRDWPFAAS